VLDCNRPLVFSFLIIFFNSNCFTLVSSKVYPLPPAGHLCSPVRLLRIFDFSGSTRLWQ